MADVTDDRPGGKRLVGLILAALGVVFGDIGTSPLYALRECFHGEHAITPSPEHVVGILSLVLWSLVLVVAVKYVVVVLRADNRGEGGILALMALVCSPEEGERTYGKSVLILLGLFGAALLYGDGMITPAISVLSAVEGLEIAAPHLSSYVIPVTLVVLIGLFLLQSRGTGGVAALFGPVMLAWLSCLAVLGVRGIVRAPEILRAVSPVHAVRFFGQTGWHGFLVLGAVFLVVTGGEALYADMGHFGRRPIRLAWFGVALPALLLNYFGQGALLLRHPELAVNPFYHLAPGWALYPLLGLATSATIIASQAVITGAFSLTWQAIGLGYLPRSEVRHTSEEEIGRIYIPQVNWLLFLATTALVLGFRTSSRLAAAYGVAVATTMVITTVLIYVAMRKMWGWGLPLAVGVTAVFLSIDLTFCAANVVKVMDGGWFPLAIAASILTIMTTWRRGRKILRERLQESSVPLETLRESIKAGKVTRVPGTAVYMTGSASATPPALDRLVRHASAVHERVLLLRVSHERTPRVPPGERVQVEDLGDGFHRVLVRFGFLETPNVPWAVRRCRELGLEIDTEELTYVLGRETLIATERRGMARWRERLFAFLSRNAGRATEFYRIPPKRVLEVGAQIKL